MFLRVLLFAAIATICVALFTNRAYAYDVRLQCNITISHADGKQYSIKRRLDITWDSRSLDVYDDWGRG
jgi:hypothetical protein